MLAPIKLVRNRPVNTLHQVIGRVLFKFASNVVDVIFMLCILELSFIGAVYFLMINPIQGFKNVNYTEKNKLQNINWLPSMLLKMLFVFTIANAHFVA